MIECLSPPPPTPPEAEPAAPPQSIPPGTPLSLRYPPVLEEKMCRSNSHQRAGSCGSHGWAPRKRCLHQPGGGGRGLQARPQRQRRPAGAPRQPRGHGLTPRPLALGREPPTHRAEEPPTHGAEEPPGCLLTAGSRSALRGSEPPNLHAQRATDDPRADRAETTLGGTDLCITYASFSGSTPSHL